MKPWIQEGGLQGPPPPAPVKTSHKKDGHRLRRLIFHDCVPPMKILDPPLRTSILLEIYLRALRNVELRQGLLLKYIYQFIGNLLTIQTHYIILLTQLSSLCLIQHNKLLNWDRIA